MNHQQRCAIKVTWKEGDNVYADGKPGIVRYVYTNGYTLVQLAGALIIGGILDNDSTFGNEYIKTN